MAGMKKYILVEIDYPEYDNDYPDDVSVNTKQFNLEEMLKQPAFRNKLMEYGWIDAAGVGDISPEGLGPRLFKSFTRQLCFWKYC